MVFLHNSSRVSNLLFLNKNFEKNCVFVPNWLIEAEQRKLIWESQLRRLGLDRKNDFFSIFFLQEGSLKLHYYYPKLSLVRFQNYTNYDFPKISSKIWSSKFDDQEILDNLEFHKSAHLTKSALT